MCVVNSREVRKSERLVRIPAIISRQVSSRESRYVAAKSFSNSSSESLPPSSVNQTDLFLFAGSEI